MKKQNRLYRSKTNRVFFGICGGLAEYMEIDPTLIRIIFILLALVPGFGILLYIIGIFIIPEENTDTAQASSNSIKSEFHEKVDNAAADIKEHLQNNPKKIGGEQVIGLIFLFIGISYLMSYLFPWFNIGKLWPLILVIIGLSLIINPRRKG